MTAACEEPAGYAGVAYAGGQVVEAHPGPDPRIEMVVLTLFPLEKFHVLAEAPPQPPASPA